MSWSKERFSYEMKKFDPLLRLRKSYDGYWWLIERRAARSSPCLVKPADNKKVDIYIQARDGYVQVMKVRYDLLNQQVFLNLRAADMWQYRGAGFYADALEEQEAKQAASVERDHANRREAAHSEAYDLLQFKQGERVSNFHQKESI